ncbi:MAG: signal recognition particle protein [Candidatus Helarchaeota archaeon]|nr:signal recognition particle protein [Candidatus Helarchaeota archaeon]
MLEEFTEKITIAFKKLRGLATISEKNINEPLRDIKRVLLDADVNYKVVKSLMEQVQKKSLGQEVIRSITPGQQIIKIFYDELKNILGDSTSEFIMKPTDTIVVMIVGLQGSGKTTFCVKLSHYARKKGGKSSIIAADPYRPAAVKQLEVMGKAANIPVFSRITEDVISSTKENIEDAKKSGYNMMIMDTAGRLHIDDEMMDELVKLKQEVVPDETLLVTDGMTGQDAVKTAIEFQKKLDITGIVLTKLDGDAKGGAALSMRAVTGKPIKFIGVGEKLGDIEVFHPDRFASRILGMGDIISLVEKAEDALDRERERQEKLKLKNFTFQDFYDQIQQLKRMGPIEQILEMIPFGGESLKGLKIDDKQFVKIEAIINSMTKEERENPKILDGRRRKRIAKGSGTNIEEVNRLLKQFFQMQKIFKNFSRFGLKRFERIQTLFGGT